MAKPKVKIMKIIFFFAIALIDIFIYIILGALFMGYEDFYDETEGPYMSLQSMTSQEKIIYFLIEFWQIVNIFIVIWLFYKAIKWTRKHYFSKKRVE